MTKTLDCFFHPKSIAILGASNRFGAWGYHLTRELIEAGFKGRVYPVNPKLDELLGLKVYPSLKTIPDKVELVIVSTLPQTVPQVIEDCTSIGVKGAVIITSGFSEVSAEGRKLEARMVEVARRGGMRLLGPNSTGIIDLSSHLNTTSMPNSFFKASPIAFISQGGWTSAILAVGSHTREMGVGTYIHTGNECDLNYVDFLEHCGADQNIKVILMHLEGLRDGRRFLQVAREVSRRKPVVVFKAGVTEAGGRAASSHTGALAGSNTISHGAFRQAGVIRSPSMELMLTLGHAFLELPPLRNNRIGIITFPGGWGAILADALTRRGLRALEFSPDLKQKLSSLGMPFWASIKNPVDIGAGGGRKAYKGLLANTTEILLSSEEVDAVVVYGTGSNTINMRGYPGGSNLELEEAEHTEKLYDLSGKYQKPLLICSFLSPEVSQTVARLLARGKRVYHNVEEIGIILASLFQYYSTLERRNIAG